MDMTTYLADRTWHGDTPVFLLVALPGQQPVVIDIDVPQWVDKNKETLDQEGTWHLITKAGEYIFTMTRHPGEQPYCLKRRINRGLGGTTTVQTSAYGIGKIRNDGVNQSIWWFEGGQICGGEDVYDIATAKNIAKMAIPDAVDQAMEQARAQLEGGPT